MKKAILTVAVAAVLLGSCKEQLPETLQSQIDEKQEEYSSKASEEMKDAFTTQLNEFFRSSDLGESLGMSAEEQDKIEQSLKEYADSYELSEEELNKTKEAISELFRNDGNMSAQSIEDKLNEILKK